MISPADYFARHRRARVLRILIVPVQVEIAPGGLTHLQALENRFRGRILERQARFGHPK